MKFPKILVGMLLAVFVLVLYCGTPSGFPEKEIRLTGMVFQLIGFFLVANALIQVQELFLDDPVFEKLIRTLSRFSKKQSKDVNVETNTNHLGLQTHRATISGVRNQDSELLTRVKNIEDELLVLRAEQSRQTDAIEETIDHLKDEQRQSGETIKTALVGGIHFEWIGLGFFVFGVVLATASPEITRLLGYLSPI